ncbi:MAG TPA: efflux RND transporter periplasmic adaptor subunit [Methylibium sp.]|uniref:efflux RND transporter periplasmic adaptor subunit n=1 Tax=Methylibium sp. TaxID=2067992 RepID=UPI002DBFC3E2|nr:efflux RND transporter periplasmic adaptor subunit [Methylibium sp.]HEU4458206.1 efflux RND transporter periplasmic adaptor subunit [Methylibium sp.]
MISIDRFRRHPRLWLAVLAAAVAALVALVLARGAGNAAEPEAKKPGSGAAAAPRPALAVTVERPRSERWGRTLGGHGNVAAWQEAVIGAEANGQRLAELRASVGDVVKRGQVLARFATETLEAQLAQQRAALAEAEAALGEARANAERARQLQATGSLSGQEITQYLTAERTAEARLAAAKASLEAQRIARRQAEVLAPDDGVISARSATVGAVVPAGTELFRLIRQGRLEWRGEFLASELGRIEPGQTVMLGLDENAGGDAVRPARIEGRVRMVGPTVDTTNRTALVYVDLAPSPRLRAGMFARGEITLGAAPALTVPATAVVVRDGNALVYRLGQGGRVQQTAVVTGRRQGERVEILQGLGADATVVVRGAGFLIDGDVVAVQDAPPATGNAPPASEPASPGTPPKAATAARTT